LDTQRRHRGEQVPIGGRELKASENVAEGGTRSVSTYIFISIVTLVLGFEVLLRVNGEIPGVLVNKFAPVDSLITENRFVSDSLGVISYDTSCHCLPSGYELNDQGYRSPIHFNEYDLDSLRSIKKIVLAVGDSYVEGCCANPVDSSFIDLINSNSNEYFILNFGVGSSNPFHYRNILSKYLHQVEPDLVLVNLYLGNDILPVDIGTPPFIPQTFANRNFTWISSTVPHFYQHEVGSTNFNSHEDAYRFYIRKFTLVHKDANVFERLLSKSVILSRLYLSARNGYYVARWLLNNYRIGDDVRRTRKILSDMAAICKKEKVPVHLSLIPAPSDVEKQVDLKQEYADLTDGFDYSHPEISAFSTRDYDGMKRSNHYNNQGHLKHSKYLFLKLNELFSNVD
jgi:hypothetical protein